MRGFTITSWPSRPCNSVSKQIYVQLPARLMADIRNYLREQVEARWYGRPGVLQLLAPFSWLYEAVAEKRRQRALANLDAPAALQSSEVEVPVVVVGNIVAGGTGKTPVVVDVVERLRRLGANPGVVARGYGGRGPVWPCVVTALSDPQCCGDEAVEIATRLGCPVVVSPDRTEAVRWLVEFFGCDVIVSDDGLQHYRLKRALEIAVVDAVRGQGNGRLLPVGPLREPTERLRSVDCVIKTARSINVRNPMSGADKAVLASPAASESAAEQTPLLSTPELFALLRPTSATHLLSNTTVELTEAPFVGEHCVALSAIGNPGRFHDDLCALGCTLNKKVLADHSSYENFIADWPKESWVVTTGKDAVKLKALAAASSSAPTADWLHHIWVINRDIVFSDAQSSVIDQLLQRVMRSANNRSQTAEAQLTPELTEQEKSDD